MFAVIETGGKQYKLAEGDTATIEKLAGEHKVGDKLVFDKVLLIDDGTSTKVGTPYIEGAKIEAELTAIGKSKKILVTKFRSKSRYSRRLGHRQPFMKAKISAVK